MRERRKYPTYPAAMKNVPMAYERRGIEGFSDHSLGIDAALLACARSAYYVEKHFSLDKTNQQDRQLAHVCSIGPDEHEGSPA
jgi:sialic acid synthase SpsE